MATIRISPFKNYSSPIVLSLSLPRSALPDHASFRVLEGSEHIFLAVMEGAAAGPVESDKYVLKMATDWEAVGRLSIEYECYFYDFAHLQGSVVPKFYGRFRGTQIDGQPIACVVLEYCPSTGAEHETDIQRAAKRAKLLDHVEKIHAEGVILNHPAYALRYVGRWDDPRIIDFTDADLHRCAEHDEELKERGEECQELSIYREDYRCMQNGFA